MIGTKRLVYILVAIIITTANVYAKSVSMIVVENHSKIESCNSATIGSIIKTAGYYKSGDEGDAEYNVIADEKIFKVDGNYIIKLRNGLLAKMNVKDGYINIKTFGCKTQEEDKRFDNTKLFQTVVDIATSQSYAVFVPVGDFVLNGTIFLPTATKILGYHGYTFRKSSRLVQTVQSSYDEDSNVMFKGVNGDVLRHIVVEGVTFLRDRTKAERAIYNNGEGYGLKSTVFGSSTELSVTNCGFIGWGHCYDNAAILFSIRTDYAYCDNILYSKTGNSSSVVIQDANIWCCGHLIRLNHYACSSIIFNNCWMEGLQTLLLAENSARIENLGFSGCTISPLSFGAGHFLIQYPKKPSWNIVQVSFSQCVVNVPGNISTDLSPMAYRVNFSDCSVHYYGEGEKITIEGNSVFWEGYTDRKSNKIVTKNNN